MRIFGLNILTDEEINNLIDIRIEDAFDYCWGYFEQAGIISQLERLKQDHWDKDAFDRIINCLKSIKGYHDNR